MKTLFLPPDNSQGLRVLVKPWSDDTCEWAWRGSTGDAVAGSGSTDDFVRQLDKLGADNTLRLELVLPATALSLRQIPLTDSERKVYRQTVPYSLEDSLLEDTEELHFAYQLGDEGQLGIAIINKDVLADLLAQLDLPEAYSLEAAVAENMLLPWTQGRRNWLYADGILVGRSGDYQGFVADADSVDFVAQSLGDTLPADIGVMHKRTEPVPQKILQAFGESCVSSPVESTLAYCLTHAGDDPVNLLQGEFRPSMPWARLWAQWQWVAYAAVIAVALNYSQMFISYLSLKSQSTAMRAEMVEVYRSAVPSGRLHDPVRQMRAAVGQINASGPTGFTRMVQVLGPKLDGKKGFAVRSISYDGNANLIRLEVEAGNFQQVEQLRAGLESSGLPARLINSSAQGEGIVARLELGGGGV